MQTKRMMLKAEKLHPGAPEEVVREINLLECTLLSVLISFCESRSKRIEGSVSNAKQESSMRFVIENSSPEKIENLMTVLRENTSLCAVGMKNVRREVRWITIQRYESHGRDVGCAQELKLVVAFDLPWRDEVMPILTNLFEGSGFIIASLDNPSLRFSFG